MSPMIYLGLYSKPLKSLLIMLQTAQQWENPWSVTDSVSVIIENDKDSPGMLQAILSTDVS